MSSGRRRMAFDILRVAVAVVPAVALGFLRVDCNRLDAENAKLKARVATLKTRVAKLESELPPPHMWNMFTGCDGERWAEDPLRPWLKPIPIAQWWEHELANGFWQEKERNKP